MKLPHHKVIPVRLQFEPKKKEHKTFVPGWARTTNLSVANVEVTAERANRLRHGDICMRVT